MIIRTVRTAQPQGPAQLDLAHPANAGAYAVSLPDGATMRPVFGPGWTAVNASALSGGVSPVGKALVNVGTGYLSRPNAVSDGWISTLLVFTPSTVAAGSFGLWSIADSFTSGTPKLFLQRSGADLKVFSNNAYQLTISNAFSVGVPVAMALTADITSNNSPHTITLAVNGKLYEAFVIGGDLRSSANEYLLSGYNGQAAGAVALHVTARGRLPDAQLAALTANPRVSPWQLFQPAARALWVPDAVGAGGGDPTGYLTATESGADTLAGSGQIIVKGSASATESAIDTAVIAGQVLVKGAITATEPGVDTLDATGGAVVIITGSMSVTESGADTLTASGKITVQGSAASSETGEDTLAAAGKVVVQGSATVTETGTDTLAAVGKVVVQGAVTVTETGTDTILANGSSQIIANGALNATESSTDTLTATGNVIVQGAASASESGADGCVATGKVLIQGLLAAAEAGGDTCFAAGQIYVVGVASATESGNDTFYANGASAGVAVYPLPDKVLYGVQYGPTGADYTGTATGGSGTNFVHAITLQIEPPTQMHVNNSDITVNFCR